MTVCTCDVWSMRCGERKNEGKKKRNTQKKEKEEEGRRKERKKERMNISSKFYRNLLTEIQDMLVNVHSWPNLDLNDGHARTKFTFSIKFPIKLFPILRIFEQFLRLFDIILHNHLWAILGPNPQIWAEWGYRNFWEKLTNGQTDVCTYRHNLPITCL